MFLLDLSPIAFSIGSISIYWYGIIYALSIVMSWKFICYLIKHTEQAPSKAEFERFMFSCIISCVIGARLGHILFFEFEYYIKHPFEIIMLRNGGLSFHGAIIGLALASFRFAKKSRYSLMMIADILSFSGAIGIFLGRIANFINQELYGIPAGVDWAVIFSRVDPLPRHPTQIYESLTEGLLSFGIMLLLWMWKKSKSIGTGIYIFTFLCTYSVSRFIIEYFKDVEIITYFNFIKLTTGQVLCMVSLVFAIFILKPNNEQKH